MTFVAYVEPWRPVGITILRQGVVGPTAEVCGWSSRDYCFGDSKSFDWEAAEEQLLRLGWQLTRTAGWCQVNGLWVAEVEPDTPDTAATVTASGQAGEVTHGCA